ncbi:Right handed beta helix region [uncultured Caudovirales phage]|uniref:Right handed beta helix region n=1 Tax=uncultured Caudovirales phage TaxID=2100421 RepID=A0A6J5RDS6_9CAUD|nr:Right handed beta helix region [uncultured Caudovirales phage]
MMLIPFGPWRPDLPTLDSCSIEATNVVPAQGSYEPQASLVGYYNALAYRCQGAISVLDSNNNTFWFSGDANSLYTIQSGIWTDISYVYSVPIDFSVQGIIESTEIGQLFFINSGIGSIIQISTPGRISLVSPSGLTITSHISVIGTVSTLQSIGKISILSSLGRVTVVSQRSFSMISSIGIASRSMIVSGDAHQITIGRITEVIPTGQQFTTSFKRWLFPTGAVSMVSRFGTIPIVSQRSMSVGASTGSTSTTLTTNIFYVSNTGSDAADGKSTGAAWQNISKVNATAFSPGDTILFERGGTWSEQLVIDTSGSAGNPITFGAYGSGARPTISGGTLPVTSGQGLVHMNGRSYVTLDGIRIYNSNYFGFYADNRSGAGNETHHLILHDCDIEASDWGGVVVVGVPNGGGASAHDITLDGCLIHNNCTDGASAEHEGSSFHEVNGFEIKNCEYYSNNKEGIDCKYNSRNGTIHDNYCHDNVRTCLYIDSANNIDIYNNRCTTSTYGISIGVESSYNPNSDYAFSINIYNNLIYDNTQGGISIWTESGATWEAYSNIHIVNNTIADNVNLGIYLSPLTTAGITTGNVIRNNVLYNNVSVSYEEVAGSFAKFTITNNLFQTGEGGAIGTSTVTTNSPGFVNEGARDYHLQVTSPAKDAGTSTNAPNVDFDGNARPYNTLYDIGAFEYTP